MTVALVLAEPGRFVLEQRENVPLVDRWASVSTIATGICGSDIHGAAGHTGRRLPGQVMGHETVGRVLAVGGAGDQSWIGKVVAIDPVVACRECPQCQSGAYQHCEVGWVLGVRSDIDGAYAGEVVVPVANLVPLPRGMTDWHGAVVEPLAVGYHAVRRGQATAADRVLIIGGGPIGQAVALAARRVGVEHVLVSEPDDRRAEVLRRLGFERTTPSALPDAVREVLGEPPTLVFDVVGIDATLDTAVRFSAPQARIVLVGMDSPLLTLPAYEISARERTIIGTICSTREHFRETVRWVAEHPEVIEVIVDRRVALADGPAVFQELLTGTLRANKVLLMPHA